MADAFDLIVIGTGVAATTIAEACRRTGWRVAIVDHRPYGGTCMLRGCDPKKLLSGVAELVDLARRFAHDGVYAEHLALSWPALMQFKRSFLAPLPDAVERRLGTEQIAKYHGLAHFVDPHRIAVGQDVLEGQWIAIATGSRPRPLAIAGVENLLTSDAFLNLDRLPESLLFVGGGYISFEFAHIAARSGTKVTILHESDRLLAQFDQDLVERLLDASRRIGIDIQCRSRAETIEQHGRGVKITTSDGRTFEADAAVHGAGRVPDIEALDLVAGGIDQQGGQLRLTPALQSVSNPAVYAAGDAASVGPMLTPVAELDAKAVVENLLHPESPRTPDYHGVPSVVFTIPALAGVGLSEEQARQGKYNFRVAQADIQDWYVARRVKADTAAFKVLVDNESHRLLGAHLIGPGAAETKPLTFLRWPCGWGSRSTNCGISCRRTRRRAPIFFICLTDSVSTKFTAVLARAVCKIRPPARRSCLTS